MKTNHFTRICLVLGLALSTAGTVIAAEELAVAKKLKIIKHPEDKLVKYGEGTVFSVVAEGEGASYQWIHNLQPMPGKTKPTLDIGKVSQKDLGVYACLVSTSAENDQPQTELSEIVALTGYKETKKKTILLECVVIPVATFIPVFQLTDPDAISARVHPRSRTIATESPLMYAMADLRFPLNSGRAESAPLFFASVPLGTNLFTVDYLPPATGGGPGSGTCPPAYKCAFHFKKTPSNLGWQPQPGVTPVTARHLQSSQTVVRWYVGTQNQCGGATGMATINNPNPNGLYKFTVYCPTATFGTCLTGLQQLELTGFLP
jgi:hypothetical protein